MGINDSLRKKRSKHYRKSGVKKMYKKSNRRKTKRRKSKKMRGGSGRGYWMKAGRRKRRVELGLKPEKTGLNPEKTEPIEESDIMYQDDLVCILRPDVKKGIIILSHFKQPPSTGSLCDLGLKTGVKLKEEGVENPGGSRDLLTGAPITRPYIFFRAPYYSREIDYSTPETEINSSYLDPKVSGDVSKWSSKVFIRVDPDRTFVFSSQIRGKDWGYPMEHAINNSKKTLSDYLKIINDNMEIKKDVKPGQRISYNLFTSEAQLFPDRVISSLPFDKNDININSEILVSIPHLTADFFVLCNP